MTLVEEKVNEHCPTRYKEFCKLNAIQENLINKYEKIINEIYQISDQAGTNGGKVVRSAKKRTKTKSRRSSGNQCQRQKQCTQQLEQQDKAQ